MDSEQLRTAFHKAICEQIFGYKWSKKLGRNVPTVADLDSDLSSQLAQGILDRMGFPPCSKSPVGQPAGKLFESLTTQYLEQAFHLIQHIRPGKWEFSVGRKLADFYQYEHLSHLAEALAQDPNLRATLGDYIVKPDIMVGRSPISDQQINQYDQVLQGNTAKLTPLRASNFTGPRPMLHASLSCKSTVRSDRAQNARTESLNLVRNRIGNTPHIVVVTAEPMPGRIASVALGTGDLDCVYRIALNELAESVQKVGDETSREMFDLLVNGKRLRDVSDLPFDLAI